MEPQTRRTFLKAAVLGGGAAAGRGHGAVGAPRAARRARPIKIGVVLPYTGVYAVLGESITQAMELVFARENWTVAGRKIEMIKEDDEMTAAGGRPQDREAHRLRQGGHPHRAGAQRHPHGHARQGPQLARRS